MVITKRMMQVAVILFLLLVVLVSCKTVQNDQLPTEETDEPSIAKLVTSGTYTMVVNTSITPINQPEDELEPEPEPISEPIVYFDIPFDEATQDLVHNRMELFGINIGVENIYALVFRESSFKQTVISNHGAMGYMQVMPATFNALWDEMLEEFPELAYLEKDLLNGETNITMGLYVMRYIAKDWGDEEVNESNMPQVYTCYNRGISGGKTYFKTYGTWESSYVGKIRETAAQILEDGGMFVY